MLRAGGVMTSYLTPAGGTRFEPAGERSPWRDVSDEAHRYLRRTGWQIGEPGPSGALWRRDGAVVAVPREVVVGSLEWHGLVERVASVERRRPDEVALGVERELTDVAHLRAANDIVIHGSIPLQAGVSLVSSAWSMLRASATTAQRLRSQIGGNFSKIGDEIIEDARLGHTQEGSYVIPVLMRHEDPKPSLPGQTPILGLDAQSAPGETPQRRVMRTFAQALDAVNRVIVKPEHTPTVGALDAFVVAGGSRELLTAVHRVLSDESVGEFQASFSWAGSVPTPGRIPREVTLPSEASTRIESAARALRQSKVSPGEMVTGVVVQLRDDTKEPFGELALQTVRSGRQVEVIVRVQGVERVRAHDWMRDHSTIVCQGRVRRTPGQRLTIDAPQLIQPLEETLIPEL
jgi:hypothetical protein